MTLIITLTTHHDKHNVNSSWQWHFVMTITTQEHILRSSWQRNQSFVFILHVIPNASQYWDGPSYELLNKSAKYYRQLNRTNKRFCDVHNKSGWSIPWKLRVNNEFKRCKSPHCHPLFVASYTYMFLVKKWRKKKEKGTGINLLHSILFESRRQTFLQYISTVINTEEILTE